MDRTATSSIRRLAARLSASSSRLQAEHPSSKFVIFGQGRTGSTLLRSLLNTHPEIRCEGEVLAEHIPEPMRLIDDLATASPQPVFGFKVKIYQLTEAQGIDPHAFLGELVARHYRIIYLRRNNLLRHAISNSFAELRGTYHDVSAGTRPTLTVDPAALIDVMRRRRAHLGHEAAVLAGLDFIEVDYEADLLRPECHQPTADRVFRALGVAPVPVTTDLSRSVSGDLSERIANFDELAAGLEGTEFAHFLTDPSYG